MKVLCKGNHWSIKDKQLILDTPEGQQTVRNMIKILEAQIRDSIYDEICALDFTQNRKQIMKYGIENALLHVQDMCAKVAMGSEHDGN